MKNVHLLPTDKPSRLWVNNLLQGKLELSELVLPCNTSQNIYITSDEKPKKGEWSIYLGLQKKYKVIEDIVGDEFPKIILTTDQDLIKDGVQDIDDEFLEWFVENPSCEWVKTYSLGVKNQLTGESGHYKYEIILPKEEPKQDRTCTHNCSVVCGECQIFEPKQETLEEFSQRFANTISTDLYYNPKLKYAIEEGAKWKAEQDKNKYSEEEMLGFAWFLVKNIGQYSCDEIAHFEGKYLEQFKNK